MPPELVDKTKKFLENTCIFCQPWWLQAIAPDSWDIAVVERGDEVAAVLPYIYKVRFSDYKLLEQPQFYSYYGPWVRESKAKYVRKLGDQTELMTELIEKLPEFATFHQWFHPSVTNWLPFYWKGYSQTTRYTYVIENTTDHEAVWGEIKENIRTDIKKARKLSEVIDEPNIDGFLRVLHATFSRQGMPMPFTDEEMHLLDSECARNQSRKILLAQDAQGRTHAGAYLVWDHRTVYAILRGSDPALRNSGAASLVLWKAIEFASSQNKSFDFSGSWMQSIERSVRAFGGKQTPFFEISKMNSRIVRAYRILWKLTH